MFGIADGGSQVTHFSIFQENYKNKLETNSSNVEKNTKTTYW